VIELNRTTHAILDRLLKQGGRRPALWTVSSMFLIVPSVGLLYGSYGIVLGFAIAILPAIAWTHVGNGLYPAVTPRAIKASQGTIATAELDAKLLSHKVKPRRYEASSKARALAGLAFPRSILYPVVFHSHATIKTGQLENKRERIKVDRYYAPGDFPFLKLVEGAIPKMRLAMDIETDLQRGRGASEKKIAGIQRSFDEKIAILHEIEYILNNEPTRIRNDLSEGRISVQEAEEQQAHMLKQCDTMWESIAPTQSIMGGIRYAFAEWKRSLPP